jgi:basic membrane protein A
MHLNCAALVLVAVIAVCFVEAKNIRIGFAYSSNIYDVSWTFTHEEARRQITGQYQRGINVRTNYSVVPVPATQLCDDLCFNKTREFIDAHNFDMVALAGSAWAPVNNLLADLYPTIKFIQSTSSPKVPRPNLAGYLAYIEQVRYLSGVVAGLTSTSGEIGYVTVNRQQQVLRQFNAFVFGVRKVRPSAKVYLISGNSFGDATADRKAAEQLLAQAPLVDTLGFQSLFAEVSRVACERNLTSVGYGSDIRRFVGDSVLTSAMWNWTPAYRYFIDQFAAQKHRPFVWNNSDYDGSISNNAVALGEYSPLVSAVTANRASSILSQVITGDDLMWCGSDAMSIVPNATYLQPGNCLSRSQMASAVRLIPGIIDFGMADLSRTASPQQARCWTEPSFDTTLRR